MCFVKNFRVGQFLRNTWGLPLSFNNLKNLNRYERTTSPFSRLPPPHEYDCPYDLIDCHSDPHTYKSPSQDDTKVIG